jgi:hypothetical protein
MVEAISSLAPSRAQRQAQRMRQAIATLAMLAAKRELKEAIRREGKRKLNSVPAREIEAMARAALMEDGEYRAKLIAEAAVVVEEWRLEGLFGKAAQGVAGAHHKEKSENAVLTGHTLSRSVTTSPQPSEVSQ